MELTTLKNYYKVAASFGEGATYDSIETRFRSVKKEAKILRTEIETGVRPAVAPPTPRKRKADNSRSAPPTPRKLKMDSGRSAPSTPRKAPKVNRELATPRETPAFKEEPGFDGELERTWSASGDYSD